MNERPSSGDDECSCFEYENYEIYEANIGLTWNEALNLAVG